jgi:UDP-GlcNAc:undecaprenyl-phosphate/decaprenyl-phosphate GlcNAc-1-phosphate transferase
VREYVLTLLVTAVVTYLLTPLVRRGATAAGGLAVPRDRDVHTTPIPRMGGLAMYGGLAAGLVVASHLPVLGSVFAGNSRLELGLLLAGGLIVVVGMVDDRWGLNPISKAAGQAAAGGILVWSGIQLSWLPLPDSQTLGLTPDQSTAVTIFLVVATINAINFIDGLDGLAAGIVCIAAIAFFVYYYWLTKVYDQPQAVPALASAVLAGACLGFLPHNFFPAKIFMGDTGSMLLGLLLAYVPISSIASLDFESLTPRDSVNRFPEILPVLLPVTILVIPYTDMVLAVVRRTRAGRSPLAADQKHLHHRLLAIGHSHRSSVLIMYLWAALFSGVIVWLSITKVKLFVLGVITLAALLALLLMSMPRLRWWQRDRAAAPAGRQDAAAGETPAALLTAPVAEPAALLAAPVAHEPPPGLAAPMMPAAHPPAPAPEPPPQVVPPMETARHAIIGAAPDAAPSGTGPRHGAHRR